MQRATQVTRKPLLKLFIQSVGQFSAVAIRLLIPSSTMRLPLRRRTVMLAAIPLFALWQLTHWIGFLLDELFFADYRQVEVKRPLFVIGPPRTGTTFLHRVLAADPRFTTFSTWECLFAPSISERKLWRALGRIDQKIGGPASRLIARLTQRLTGGLEAVHKVTLAEPEEDYLVLLPVFASFILVVGAPHAESVWRMGYFDQALAPAERRQLMQFYRRCLQKHLYVHGTERTLLSKNASFAPLVGSLLETFADARIICTMRDPLAVVPSQLSAVRSGLWGMDAGAIAEFDQRMINVLRFHYRNLFTVLARRPPWQRVIVSMHRIKGNLVESVCGIYRRLEISMDEDFLTHLNNEAPQVRRHRSNHHYALGNLGLTETAIRRQFHHAYRRYDFAEGALKGSHERPMPTPAPQAVVAPQEVATPRATPPLSPAKPALVTQ